MNIFTSIINFIMFTIRANDIDESHGIKHSFDTMHFANQIFEAEKKNYPELIPHERIIYVSSAIHDMCDNKYMITNEGQKLITDLLENKITNSESQAVDKIINSMSYSKVKAKGFPGLGKYQQAYHVVREADLLCAYDFDRCILYHLYKKNTNIESAYDESVDLFMNRMLQHEKDNLFTYEYTKQQANVLKFQSLNRIKQWKKIIKSF